MTNPRDERPTPSETHDMPAPPRLLLWAVIGVFVLALLGTVGGILVFRFALQPAQQERVMGVLPFMDAFLPPRPAAGDTLPTPESAGSEDISPEDLLEGLTLPGSTPEATTPEPDAATPTLEITPTPEPTVVTPQPTPQPTLATPEPTPQTQSEPRDVATANQQTIAQPAPTESPISLPINARMSGFRFEQQTWNNCGPANVTMALSYYGWQQNQEYAAQFLKPGGREDKNVSPWELVSFVNTQSQVRALTRVGGTLDLLKRFIANNIPVIIETGYTPEGYDWLGHYQTLVGYDDSLGIFWLYDSFLGAGENGEGINEAYSYVDANWQHFNRRFIVIYEPQREQLVRDLLGDYADPQQAATLALETATAEANANPQNGHAWFNMGTSLTLLGDYSRAAIAFDRARREGLPWRMLWYQFEAFEAYYQDGRYDELLSLVNANLSNGANYVEETYFWQGKALAAKGDTGGAATAFRTALRLNPTYTAAQEALAELGI